MSNILRRLGKLLPFGRNKPVGYDLDGNRFFEWPNPAGGRPRRSVEYKIKRDIPDYLVQERLPIQWMSWLSHTRPDPPSTEELQKDQQRRLRLAYNVAQIEARDAEESMKRRLLNAPTESAEMDPSARGGRTMTGGTTQPVGGPESWARGDPRETYGSEGEATGSTRKRSDDPLAYTPPSTSSTSRSGPRHSTPRDAHDPNAPVDEDLRARSRRETELARRRMEVSKSPLSGYVPLDPGRSERAGRVGSDSVKGDEERGDPDARQDPGSVVLPRPRRRGGSATASNNEPVDLDALAAKGRVDATGKNEVQDVQAGSEKEIREKAEELERR